MSTAKKLKPQRLPKPVKPETSVQAIAVLDDEPVIIKKSRELQIGVPENKKIKPAKKTHKKHNKALAIPREKGVEDRGAPKYDRNEIVQKLNEAFSIGCTDNEACCYAGISRALFYLIQQEIPDFLDTKEVLKAKPDLMARKTMFENLSTPEGARWYLERKKKDEFGNSPLIELNQMNVLTDERKAEIAQATRAWSYTDPEEDERDSDYEVSVIHDITSDSN